MNLMEEMRNKYYPYNEKSKNLQEALQYIKEEMENGSPYIELYDRWQSLAGDWYIEKETLDELKKQGFRIIKRWYEKEKNRDYYSYIISWDNYQEFNDTDEVYE